MNRKLSLLLISFWFVVCLLVSCTPNNDVTPSETTENVVPETPLVTEKLTVVRKTEAGDMLGEALTFDVSVGADYAITLPPYQKSGLYVPKKEILEGHFTGASSVDVIYEAKTVPSLSVSPHEMYLTTKDIQKYGGVRGGIHLPSANRNSNYFRPSTIGNFLSFPVTTEIAGKYKLYLKTTTLQNNFDIEWIDISVALEDGRKRAKEGTIVPTAVNLEVHELTTAQQNADFSEDASMEIELSAGENQVVLWTSSGIEVGVHGLKLVYMGEGEYSPTDDFVRYSFRYDDRVTDVIVSEGGNITPPGNAKKDKFTHVWQNGAYTEDDFTDVSEDLTLCAVYTPSAVFTVNIHHGENAVIPLTVYDGQKIEEIAGIMETYVDKNPYYTEKNGVEYRYSHVYQHRISDQNGNAVSVYDKNTADLYAVYEDFSVIDVPLNKNNTDRKDGEYKVLAFSDLHYGFMPGGFESEIEHTFFSGKNICIDTGDSRRSDYPKPNPSSSYISHAVTVTFPAGTPVTYHEQVTVTVNNKRTLYQAEETVTYTDVTTVLFEVPPTTISIPDGTTVKIKGAHANMRACLMVDLLLREYSLTHYDAIMMVGDIASNDSSYYNNTNEIEDHLWLKLKNRHFSRLDDAGIPWFFVNGNHDDLGPTEWEQIFPNYTKNFCVRLGGSTAAILAFDGFATPTLVNSAGDYGDESDIDAEAILAFDGLVKSAKDAVIYMHYSNLASNSLIALKKANDNIRVVIQGHTHFDYAKKLSEGFYVYDDGGCSWNADIMGMAGRNPDGTPLTVGSQVGDSNTAAAGCWSFTYIESCIGTEGRKVLYYRIFPELNYGKMTGSGSRYQGRVIPAFYQERYSTEGEINTTRYAVVYHEE